jgi:hypothetical protein
MQVFGLIVPAEPLLAALLRLGVPANAAALPHGQCISHRAARLWRRRCTSIRTASYIGSRAAVVARSMVGPVCRQLRKCRVRPDSYAWCHERSFGCLYTALRASRRSRFKADAFHARKSRWIDPAAQRGRHGRGAHRSPQQSVGSLKLNDELRILGCTHPAVKAAPLRHDTRSWPHSRAFSGRVEPEYSG